MWREVWQQLYKCVRKPIRRFPEKVGCAVDCEQNITTSGDSYHELIYEIRNQSNEKYAEARRMDARMVAQMKQWNRLYFLRTF